MKKKKTNKIVFKDIKRKAYETMMENKMAFWLPYGFILILNYAFSDLASTLSSRFNTCLYKLGGECALTKGDLFSIPISIVLSLFTAFLSYGLAKIVLSIVRHESTSFNDIFTYKSDLFKLFLLNFIISFLTSFGYVFLVVPGVILTLMFSQVEFINVDKNLSISELLKESRELMKGHKWNYLVFNLSFIGWILLGIFSFGILFIFIMPYIMYANALYYEELVRLKENDTN